MPKKPKAVLQPDETIMNKILVIRDKKVMSDRDLAELYGVTTYRLNEQVKRNIKRFPKDFMFRVTRKEKQEMIQTYKHLEPLKFSPVLPYVFTEHGAVMLASVLNSSRAIKANIQIVRIFTKMREMTLNLKDVLLKVAELENQTSVNTEDIKELYQQLKVLVIPKIQSERKRIGFRRKNEKE